MGDSLMKLRWNVQEEVSQRWCNQEDDYVKSRYWRKPVLQYSGDGVTWIDVERVITNNVGEVVNGE
jgi:hypothetical protein